MSRGGGGAVWFCALNRRQSSILPAFEHFQPSTLPVTHWLPKLVQGLLRYGPTLRQFSLTWGDKLDDLQT
eukprot:1134189-Pelagomonas_calceolata.AAC.3